MPAGSKMGPPLAKAEPISNGGNTSGITFKKRGKNVEQQTNREVRVYESNNSADTKPMEVNAGADIYLQPMEDLTMQKVGARKRP
ncbi:protein pxr1-like [Limosa lapponica baueri]|uniref:Protein pxr1-like n=1 Tax=Limosa lapponica baueri TaxID=1758121 RepID=A0A2I0U024_LIMLA|nr:protein pxr1-like [Limosa lapponica baueri]